MIGQNQFTTEIAKPTRSEYLFWLRWARVNGGQTNMNSAMWIIFKFNVLKCLRAFTNWFLAIGAANNSSHNSVFFPRIFVPSVSVLTMFIHFIINRLKWWYVLIWLRILLCVQLINVSRVWLVPKSSRDDFSSRLRPVWLNGEYSGSIVRSDNWQRMELIL